MTPFTKYESIGNDFVLLDTPEISRRDFTNTAIQMCDRNRGIGSDGLLVVDTKQSPIPMRMFNPDGTEDFCGNGLRCAALHAQYQGIIPPMKLLHGGGEIDVVFGLGGWIEVALPPASFDPMLIPLADGVTEIFHKELFITGRSLRIASLTTGSTHTVIFWNGGPSDEDFLAVSPVLENHEWFPKRTSVIWAWDDGVKQIRIRIWERGAGETLGCGTGSAAAAACWFRNNPNLAALGVVNPGGEVVASKGFGGSIVISARAKRVFAGEFIPQSL